MASIAAQPAVSETVRRFLGHEPKLLIDGKWVTSSAGARIASYDPSTGREIASVVDATAKDVERAVGAARRAFDDCQVGSGGCLGGGHSDQSNRRTS